MSSAIANGAGTGTSLSVHSLLCCRHAHNARVEYEEKMERANNLYHELNLCMQQLKSREKELAR